MNFNGKNLEWKTLPFFSGNVPWVEADGRVLCAEWAEDGERSAKLIFREANLEWLWQWSVEADRLVLKSTLTNHDSQPHTLGKLAWVDAALPDFLKADPSQITLLERPYDKRGYYCQLTKLDDPACFRTSARFVEFFDRKQQRAVQFGFLTFRKCLNFVSYQENLQAVADYAKWVLEPGKTIECDVFTAAFGSDPMQQLEDWATRAGQIVQPKFRHRPALGFLGGSWIDGLQETPGFTEEMVLANARAIHEKLSGFGFEYIWVSLANIPGGNPGAYTGWNYNHFPSGLRTLVDKLAAEGLKLGFWVGPYFLSSHLPEMVKEMQDAILLAEDGKPIDYYPVWSHGDAGHLPLKERPKLFSLDPSSPKVQAYLDKVFTHYRENGVRYYMIDFLEAGSGAILRHPYLTHCDASKIANAEVLTDSLQKIRKAIGEETYILTSTGPLLEVAGFADAVRVGNDFGEGRAIAKDSNFYPASFVINGSFTAAEKALSCAAVSYYTHGKLYWNDSGNVLTVDQPIPLESARIHATIHALSGSASMLGDDLCYIAPERLAMIKKTLPRSVENARPLDLFDAENWPPHIFYRHIEQGGEVFDVVAVYNFSGEARTEKLDLEKFGYTEKESIFVWEFWTESYMGSFRKTLETVIPPESVRVFRLTKGKHQPQILGTDMHVQMGAEELSDVVWDAKNGTLSFAAMRPAGETGSVFLRLEEGTHIEDSGIVFTARNRDGIHGDLVVRIPLAFDGSVQRRTLKIVTHQSIANDKYM